jgi:hypothetical protein
VGKRFKGKTCVYCAANPSTTGDHVFARKFFAVKRRDNLPQVPACSDCNGKKSELEHYLTTILLLGGRHPDAQAEMLEKLPKRLAKNAKLHRELRDGLSLIGGPSPLSGRIPVQVRFDGQKVHDFLRYVTKGLLWHHWKVILDPQQAVHVASLTVSGERLFAYLFQKHAKRQVSVDLGGGTFRYVAAQGHYPEFSLWGFSLLGGIVMNGTANKTATTSTVMATVTGQPETMLDPAFVTLLATEADLAARGLRGEHELKQI